MKTTFEHMVSSQSNEWYTPPYIIEAAIAVMDEIDLDPASNPIAQKWIKAKTYFTKTDNGFEKNWFGRVWLNPPYGKKSKKSGNYGAGAWFTKAYESYLKGEISEAIILGRGDSEGIKMLMRSCLFCECDRISFVGIDEYPKDKPVPGTKIFYLGSNPGKFAQLFKQFGIILKACE